MNTTRWRSDELYISIKKMIDLQCTEISTKRMKAKKKQVPLANMRFNKIIASRRINFPSENHEKKKSLSLDKILMKRALPVKTLEIAESYKTVLAAGTLIHAKKKFDIARKLYTSEYQRMSKHGSKLQHNIRSQLL